MANRNQKQIVQQLLDLYGQTFAGELGLNLEKPTGSDLFGLLVFSMLGAKRIRHDAAMRAAKALHEAGYTSAQKMADATWEQRVKVLNTHGYARYDESTSRFLGETSLMLLEKYDGDLNNLRQAASNDPARERKLLKEFTGIGEVGVDIFFREAQVAWEELYPFADPLALRAAATLGLGNSAQRLAKRVPRADFARLVAALVRAQLDGETEHIKHAA